MWKFNPFGHKEQQSGLEGRVIDIGNFKIQVRNAIAEGGFSSVYSARDAIHGSKQFALKHMICNDEESLELVKKEISVMKMLKGHPNVVTLHAHSICDMGRTKEALLLMEYCEKSLVDVLESRGAGFFEEKQVVTIFRDVCNAVFAMHCQSPPIAHRDLKAENLLLGSDGLWKLCDFGSTSTNHKRFEKPEEMGIEEDNIRKHTTPAYRAPEMWDLFRRDLISEKVDIWALGCLLFRICFFKSAFDGESKLQVLNGNYRIPDLPKYSTSLTDLIRDLLQSSPDDRPDITQVWFRVNDLLPDGLQKSLPDRPHEMLQHCDDVAGMSKSASKTSPMPRRSPPPPPLAEAPRNATSASNNSRTGESANPLGAFWTTQHAKDSEIREHKTRPKYDEEVSHKSAVNEKKHSERPSPSHTTSKNDQNSHKNSQVRSVNNPSSKDSPINLFPDNLSHGSGRFKQPIPDIKPAFQDDAFTAFVADFDPNKQSLGTTHQNLETEQSLKAEVEKLREQLARVSSEKAEVTYKFEKLSAICRTQRQEIQDLKQALAARTPSPNKDSSKKNLASLENQSSTTQQNQKIEGTVWELQEGLFERRSPSPDPQQWQAFTDDSKRQTPTTTSTTNNTPRSVRTKSSQQDRAASAKQASDNNNWGFETESFKVVPNPSSKVSVHIGELSSSRRFGEANNLETKVETRPAGWAGF